jgi:hypothetical protein
MKIKNYTYSNDRKLILEYEDFSRKEYNNVPDRVFKNFINSRDLNVFEQMNLKTKFESKDLEPNYQLIYS